MVDRQKISFRLEDYDYDLPPELIAQRPAPVREQSRLLVLERSCGAIEHSRFDRIGQYLRPGDLLVVNDTRVVPARLTGRKETGGMVELLVLDPYKPPRLGALEGYCCLTRASKGIRAGQSIELSDGICAEVISAPVDGRAQVRFSGASPILDILDRIGQTPLPPYIERASGRPADDDRICYQTEYARHPGAVAAPTAGLHFTKSLLDSLMACGDRNRRADPSRRLRHFCAAKMRGHSRTPDAPGIYRDWQKDRRRGKQGKAREQAGGRSRDHCRSHPGVGSRKGGRNSSFPRHVRSLHLSGLPVCGCRLHGDQFSSPEVQPDPAGVGFRRTLPDIVRLPGSDPGALPLLQLRRCNADRVGFTT